MTPAELKGWRVQRGLTQRQAAAELEVALVTLKKWERGEYPISRTAAKLVRLLVAYA